jgi:hypothetical protein
METREEPLTQEERIELQGYVSWGTRLSRVMISLIAVAAAGGVFWRLQALTAIQEPWWLLPTALIGAFLWIRSPRWTGGSELRNRILQDLSGGVALVQTARVEDAILFEEHEDEGPTVILKLSSGETVGFAGQYLDDLVDRGFPWSVFEIRETPHARMCLRIKKRGGPIEPSLVRPQLSFSTLKTLGLIEAWKILPGDFERFREIA